MLDKADKHIVHDIGNIVQELSEQYIFQPALFNVLYLSACQGFVQGFGVLNGILAGSV